MTRDDPGGPSPILIVDGAVESPLRLDDRSLAGLPPVDQIPDVGAFHPGRNGVGVDLAALLRLARPRPEATHLTLHADRDDFHVSIPLDQVGTRGMLVYRLGDRRLDPDQGGPFRFLIRDPASCHSAELDDCANVKYVSRIELTVGRGADTRPADDGEHAALHARQGTPPD